MTPRDAKLSDFDKKMAPLQGSETPMMWHEPGRAPFRLAGFAWYGTDGMYRRMPVTPAGELPEAVDHLANHTAGGQVSGPLLVCHQCTWVRTRFFRFLSSEPRA